MPVPTGRSRALGPEASRVELRSDPASDPEVSRLVATQASPESGQPAAAHAASIEGLHKTMTKTIVIPAMGAYTIAFYIACMSSDPRVIGATVLGVVVGAVNAWLTSRTERTRKDSQSQQGRADRSDFMRWFITIVFFDTTIFGIIAPSIGILTMTWTMLLITAQADMFRKQFRLAVVVVGVVAAAAQILWIGRDAMREALLLVFGMIAVIHIFNRLAGYWTSELIRRCETEIAEALAQERAKSMERSAQLGLQTQTIAHELANLISIVDFATSNSNKIDFERLHRSLLYIKQINRIVLKDLSGRVRLRAYSVNEMVKDVELLVKKDVRTMGAELLIEVPELVKDTALTERSGSTFLVLRNLLKNATEAALAAAEADSRVPSVGLRFEQANDQLVITVTDNGVGMSPEKLACLMAGNAPTTKAAGHGIGFRFVLDECKRNGFGLVMESAIGTGTTAKLTAAVAPAGLVAERAA